MSPHRQASKVLRMAATEVDETEAARRLLVAGIDVTDLAGTRTVIESLDLDAALRDRALLLLARTQLLAERSAARAAEGDELRAAAETAAAPNRGGPTGVQPSGARPPRVGEPQRSLGMLVHELRTPLTVAQMAAQYLADHLDDRAAVERMGEMVRRNTRMALYLLDHLALSDELRTGELALEPEQVDLAALVTDCVQDVRQLLPAERPVVVAADADAGAVRADPSAIRQVIFNLLVNAAKFSPTATPIEVTVHRDGLSVRDHGPGIDPAERERIFQEGSQTDPDATGSGLGLFISRRVADAHGGELVLDEPTDGGARFILRLPVVTRKGSADQRQAIADLRDAILDRRDRIAAEREAALTDREEVARRRDLDLGRRELAADVRERVLDDRQRTTDARGDADGPRQDG